MGGGWLIVTVETWMKSIVTLSQQSSILLAEKHSTKDDGVLVENLIF